MLQILVFSNSVLCQDSPNNTRSIDTTIINKSEAGKSAEDDEFNLFLFAFATGAFCFIAGCFVIGVVAALLFLVLLVSLISFGIISTSIFIGIYKRSASIGFKLFCIISGIVIGTILGLLTFGVISYLFKLNLSASTITITGIGLGSLTGGFVGFTVFYLLRKGFRYISKKYKIYINNSNRR